MNSRTWTLLVLLSLLIPRSSAAIVFVGKETTAGKLVLSFSNLGYFGSLLNNNVSYASCEYPRGSRVEHLYAAGPWVGALDSEGQKRVSIGANDTAAGPSVATEFGPRSQDSLWFRSSNPDSPYFSPDALADQHFLFDFDDDHPGSGSNPGDSHVPLHVRVHAKVLAYAASPVDDFVLIQLTIENIGSETLQDVYLGWYSELTIGPRAALSDWVFYDDIQGFFGPADVPGFEDLRMVYGYDFDGDDGAAPSWIGIRYLGADIEPATFSYRQWRFGQSPRFDVEKYDAMASGVVDVGGEFEVAGNWSSMIALGPWPLLVPGQTAQFTLAVVGGMDRDELLAHSEAAQKTYDHGFVPVADSRESVGSLKARFRRP